MLRLCADSLGVVLRTNTRLETDEVGSTSNSGVCPGSIQPGGLFMCAMLSAVVPEFTRPTCSRMILGLFPAAITCVGFEMCLAI
jgi:hypothetical protein